MKIQTLRLTGRNGWNLYPERTPFTRYRVQPDSSAHPLHGFLGHRQANPCAFVFDGRVYALEHSENSGVLFRGNANAVVLETNPHAERGGFFGADANARKRSGRDEFNGVGQEIGDA